MAMLLYVKVPMTCTFRLVAWALLMTFMSSAGQAVGSGLGVGVGVGSGGAVGVGVGVANRSGKSATATHGRVRQLTIRHRKKANEPQSFIFFIQAPNCRLSGRYWVMLAGGFYNLRSSAWTVLLVSGYEERLFGFLPPNIERHIP